MEEKSAIDLIYEMHEMLQNLEAKVSLMEKNINFLNDKTNGNLMQALSTNMPQLPKGVEVESVQQEQSQPPVPPATAVSTSQAAPRLNTRVTGQFHDTRNKPISGVEVRIINANNDVVKETRTNKAGRWTSFLPPGQYSVEFMKEGMQPMFRVFDVLEGQAEIEI